MQKQDWVTEVAWLKVLAGVKHLSREARERYMIWWEKSYRQIGLFRYDLWRQMFCAS